MRTLLSGACGVLFGAGLAISGMTNPAKVLAFLDVSGRWDPSLALVMCAALAVAAPAFALARGRARPWLGGTFALPTRRDVDPQLVGGAALFGVGWALVGLCPGPALASLARGAPEVAIFVGAMLGGAWLTQLALRARSTSRAAATAP
jgi:uncharacterized membrane protein YedE/YeeE